MVSHLLSLSLEFCNCLKKSNVFFFFCKISVNTHAQYCHCHTAGKTASSVISIKPGHIHYLHVITIIRCVSTLCSHWPSGWSDVTQILTHESWLYFPHMDASKLTKQTDDWITSLQKTMLAFFWHLDFILFMTVIKVCQIANKLVDTAIATIKSHSAILRHT